MSEKPATEQDIRPVWFVVQRRNYAPGGPAWIELARGEATVDDVAAMVIDLGNGWLTDEQNPVRVRVWDNEQYEGEPITEHHTPAASVPWVTPPAQMANPTVESEELPGRVPGDVPPPLKPVEVPPPTIDTLLKLLQHMRSTLEDPNYDPRSGYQSPPLAIPTDELPEDLQDLLQKAFERFVNQRGARRATPAEEKLLEVAEALDRTLHKMSLVAQVRTPGSAWWQHPDLLNGAALVCQHYMSTWTIQQLED